MKGFTQVSRTNATEESHIDPLTHFSLNPPPSSSNKEENLLGLTENDFEYPSGRSQSVEIQDQSEYEAIPRSPNPQHKMRIGSHSGKHGLNQRQSPSPSVLNHSLSTNNFPADSTQETSPPSSLSSSLSNSIQLMTGEKVIRTVLNCTVHSFGDLSSVFYLTNYRVFFSPRTNDIKKHLNMNPSLFSWLQVPLATIDKIEREKRSKETLISGISVLISTKDCRQVRFNLKSDTGSNGDYELERSFNMLLMYAFPNNLRDLFAFHHKIWPKQLPTLQNEYDRLGILTCGQWRVSFANAEYKLCQTYPSFLLAPKEITDDEMTWVASFRAGSRLPVLCWQHATNQASLWRSAQPKAGMSGSCYQDEKMLNAISQSTRSFLLSQNNHSGSREVYLSIVDCRSRASAMANRAAGAGYESQSNYPTSRLEFYNIPNIHGVRDSLKSVTSIVLNPSANPSSDTSFTKQIDDTQWLTNLRLILKAAWETANSLNRGIPVLVHCSHGWDRTAQVCSLSQLLLDPYYRTMEGFAVLIEKEWCSFGHPFQARCGHGQNKHMRQDDEISPIFLQFLDCVLQIHKQFTYYFEFNHRFLLCIADHIYSGRFDNFLFSCDHDRKQLSPQKGADIWTYLFANRAMFINPLYEGHTRDSGALLPPLSLLLRGVSLWSDYFLRWSSVLSLSSAPPSVEPYLHVDYRNEYLSPASLEVKNAADLSLLPVVTTNDLWEGAYWRERTYRRHQIDKNIQIQDLATQLNAQLQGKISNEELASIHQIISLANQAVSLGSHGLIQQNTSEHTSNTTIDSNSQQPSSTTINATHNNVDDILIDFEEVNLQSTNDSSVGFFI